MALKEWQNTNSPITHWHNMAMRYLDSDSAFYEPDRLYALPSDYNTFFYGLPKKDETMKPQIRGRRLPNETTLFYG